MIVVVIPAYNEATTIANVVAGALRHAEHVAVVDDGSSDGTGKSARLAGALVVSHPSNYGPGAATMSGIRVAVDMGATAVVTLDGDDQHDPTDIPILLEPLRANRADIVFANRFGRPNPIPLSRRFFNWCGNCVTLLATKRWVADSQCGLKAFGPRALAQLDITATGFEFCTQIVRESIRHRWRIAEVPSRVRYSATSLAKGQSFLCGMRTAFAILQAATPWRPEGSPVEVSISHSPHQ